MESPDSVILVIESRYVVMIVWGVLIVMAIYKVQYLLAFFCCYPSMLTSIRIGPFFFVHVIFILLLIGIGLSALKHYRSNSLFLYYKPNVWLFIFSIVIIFSLFFVSEDRDHGLYKLKPFLYFSIIPYVFFQLGLFTPIHIREFFYGYILVSVSASIFGYYTYDTALSLFPDRLSAFGDAITFAIPLGVSCFCLLYLFLESRQKGFRILFALALAWLIFVLILTGTRQVLITLIFFSFALCILRLDRRVVLYITIIVVLVISAFLFSETDRFGKFGTRILSGMSDTGGVLSERIETWLEAIKTFISSPLYGIGLGSFGTYTEWQGRAFKTHTHNLFLEILAEEGLIGFVVFTRFLYTVFQCSLKILQIGSPELRFFGTFLSFALLMIIIQTFLSGGIDSTSAILFISSAIVTLYRYMTVSLKSYASVTRSFAVPSRN